MMIDGLVCIVLYESWILPVIFEIPHEVTG